VRAQPDEMTGNALQLGQEYARVLDLLADLVVDAQQALDRQRVGQVVAERGQIVHAVGQHQRLVIGLGLGGLLDAGMQIADIGNGLDNRFALDGQDEP
jgi:hypothetical protein